MSRGEGGEIGGDLGEWRVGPGVDGDGDGVLLER